MGVSIGDYNRDGNLDIVKTNFAGDTDSLYTNLGDGIFEDRTYPSGLGVNTRLLGWGVGFFDMDNDGWLDILMSNGHVYPEVDRSKADLKYAEHKYLYRNLQQWPIRRGHRKGRAGNYGERAGARLRFRRLGQRWGYGHRRQLRERDSATVALRFHAEAQLDQDQARRREIQPNRHRQPRHGHRQDQPAADKSLVQIDELRSGGSYFSQNDMRMHFGLDQATKVDMVEIRWLSGQVDQLKDLDVNRLYVIQEGGKILKAEALQPAKKS